MTITKPVEVVGYICKHTSARGLYAKITVRVEPSKRHERVVGPLCWKSTDSAFAPDEQRFAEAAFKGIESVLGKYSWLTFRLILTEARLHAVDSSERTFYMAGEDAARKIMQAIYKKLTITALNAKTKICVADPDGHLVQAEVGLMDTSLLQGEYDVRFGDGDPIRIDLQKDMVLNEGR